MQTEIYRTDGWLSIFYTGRGEIVWEDLMRQRYLLLIAFVVLILMPEAQAQDITECNDAEGYAYYFAGGAVSPRDAGMRKDGITGGRIILNIHKNEVDLILKGASGSTFSVRGEGGKIVVLRSSEGFISLNVSREEGSTFETYLFQLDKGGNGTVVHTRLVSTEMMNKSSLMVSRCFGPRTSRR